MPRELCTRYSPFSLGTGRTTLPLTSGMPRYHLLISIPDYGSPETLADYSVFLQESYFTYDSSQTPSPVDHDVHFRPGIGAKGEETYTPRTLIYDLKGGFGGLRKWGGLYDQQHLDEGEAIGDTKGVW